MTLWNPDAVAPAVGDVYERERQASFLTVSIILRAIALGGVLMFALMLTRVPA